MQARRAGAPGTSRAPRRLLLVTVALLLVASGCAYTVNLEPVSNVARSTFIYDAAGNLLTTLHAEEDREPVALDEIADVLVDAVIAIEDERFFVHGGVDLRATTRALFRNIEGGEVAEGGSTLTQQYVKNVLISREKTVGRKVKEASLAYQLEKRHSKEEILERYLNTVYFGNGAYGAQAAAKRWFGKTAVELTLEEASLLAGMIRAPERYNPFENPEVAQARQALVLRRMVELDMITEREAADAGAELPDFIELDERYPAGHYVEAVKRFILDNEEFGETRQERRDLLFKGGLRIYTNIDMRMQRAAEQAAAEGLAEEPNVISALVAIEPGTGKVRAVWGGHEFFEGTRKAKFDYATQGGRQSGSSFKPFALVAALVQGIGPEQVYPAPGRITLEQPDGGPDWEVSNYGGGGAGALTLAAATARSTNTVYAQLILDVGPENAIEIAREMGIKSPLQENPAAVLGTNDVNPLDMASAFGTLAADGVYTEPKFIDRIEGPGGDIVYQAPKERERVLSEMVSRNATKMLERVVCCGTARRAILPDGRDQAGKTGTAQRWRDAWYVGYTPDLVAAVWVGHPDGQISMAPPLTSQRVTGGSYPAEIWRLFMERALEGIPPSDFPEAPRFETTKKIKTRLPCDLLYSPIEDEETGEIIGYERNNVDNDDLEDAGYTGRIIAGAETCPPPELPTTTTSTTTSSTPTSSSTQPPTTSPPITTTTKPPTTTTKPPTTTTTSPPPPTTTTTSPPPPTTTTTSPPPPTTTTEP